MKVVQLRYCAGFVISPSPGLAQPDTPVGSPSQDLLLGIMFQAFFKPPVRFWCQYTVQVLGIVLECLVMSCMSAWFVGWARILAVAGVAGGQTHFHYDHSCRSPWSQPMTPDDSLWLEMTPDDDSWWLVMIPAWRPGGGYKHKWDILGRYGTYYLDTALTVCHLVDLLGQHLAHLRKWLTALT